MAKKTPVGTVTVKLDNLEQLEEDFDNLASSLAKVVSKYAAKKMEDAHWDVLTDYYKDPVFRGGTSSIPRSYRRTYQLKRRSKEDKPLSYKKYTKNADPYRAYGGVRYTPESLHYFIYRKHQKVEWAEGGQKVIDSFLDGWHGANPEFSVKAKFDPTARLKKKQKEMVRDICYGEAGSALIAEAKANAGLKLIM